MSDVRVRRHTDGRIAIHARNKYAFCWFSTDGVICQWLTNKEITGAGWSELLVAELPEPDGEALVDDVPFWDTNVGRIFGDDAHEFVNNYGFDDLNEVRSDALKMLAAVAACERYRTERI